MGHEIVGQAVKIRKQMGELNLLVKKYKYSVNNRRIGETAPGARLTDREVELMRELHEEHPVGHPEHVGFRKLARMFNVSRNTVSNICHYRKRVAY